MTDEKPNLNQIRCPLCDEIVNRHQIETKESEIPVFSASRDFGGDVSTYTEQRTQHHTLPCGCHIKTV